MFYQKVIIFFVQEEGGVYLNQGDRKEKKDEERDVERFGGNKS